MDTDGGDLAMKHALRVPTEHRRRLSSLGTCQRHVAEAHELLPPAARPVFYRSLRTQLDQLEHPDPLRLATRIAGELPQDPALARSVLREAEELFETMLAVEASCLPTPKPKLRVDWPRRRGSMCVGSSLCR